MKGYELPKWRILLTGLILDTNGNFALRLARPWNAGLKVMLIKRAHTWTPLYVTSCRKLLLWGSWTIPSPVLRSWVGTGATPVLVATSAGFRTIPCAPSSPVTVNYRSKKRTLKIQYSKLNIVNIIFSCLVHVLRQLSRGEVTQRSYWPRLPMLCFCQECLALIFAIHLVWIELVRSTKR